MANLRKDTDFDWLDRIGFKCGDKVDVEVFIWDPEMPTPENLEYDFFSTGHESVVQLTLRSGRVCRARNRVADHIEDAVSSMKSGLVPTHGWWRREVHRYKSPTEFKVRKKETREASFYEVKAIISTKHALKPYCKWADSVASAAADSVSAVHDRAKQLAEAGNAGVIVCIENTPSITVTPPLDLQSRFKMATCSCRSHGVTRLVPC